MQELEIKLSIDRKLIKHPVNNPVFFYFEPIAKHYIVVNQTDSYRQGDPDLMTRLRAHEQDGEILFCTKTLANAESALFVREEKEKVIGRGFNKEEIHCWTRKMRSDLPEIAVSRARRTLVRLHEGGNVGELCIDIGATYTPDDRLTGYINEIELELKKGSPDWLQDKGDEIRGHIYELTGYVMRPAPSKGHIARIGAEVARGRYAQTPSC